MMNVKIVESSANSYGFSILPPDGFEIMEETIDPISNYLVVKTIDLKSNNVKCFIFRKNRELVSWNQRADEIKGDVQIKKISDKIRIERKRKISLKTGEEYYEDTLYNESNKLADQKTLVEYINESPILELYETYIENTKLMEEYDQMSLEEKKLYWLKFIFHSIKSDGVVSAKDIRKRDSKINLDMLISAYANLIGEDDLESVKSEFFTDI